METGKIIAAVLIIILIGIVIILIIRRNKRNTIVKAEQLARKPVITIDAVKDQTMENKVQPANEIEPDHILAALKNEKDWIVGVEVNDSIYYYDKVQVTAQLRDDILEGRYVRTNKVVVHARDKDGKWQKSDFTLEKFTKNHFKLRVLYEPIWSHVMAGLKWGAIAGILIKLADTCITLYVVDPLLAIMFAAAIGVCVIPRIGWIGVAAVTFLMVKYTTANLFLIGIVAAVTGGILGCLPGMAIGGIIGYCRKSSFQKAKDAEHEPGTLVFKAVIIPLVTGCALLIFYIFVFNPWLISVLD